MSLKAPQPPPEPPDEPLLLTAGEPEKRRRGWRWVAAAEKSLSLAQTRYQGGITSYLEVITAQSSALANERAAVDLRVRRMTAAVDLVRALGGGWSDSDRW